MGTKKRFVILTTDKTSCPTCNTYVDLVTGKDILQSGPSFYICWNCRTISQAGVGPVEREQDNDRFVSR